MQSALRNPTTVYIVDDSAPIRACIAELLACSGSSEVVGQADTADDAIAGIRSTAPDAVILDVHLRDSSGLDVLKAFRNAPGAPAFILITNDPADAYRKACIALGARAFLDKSSDFLRINDIVGSLRTRVA